MTKLLIITDDPKLAAMNLAPSPARLWSNITHSGAADFRTLRLDPAGPTKTWAEFDAAARASGMIYLQDAFGPWRPEHFCPPYLSDEYVRTYRRAMQAMKNATTLDQAMFITDFEGMTMASAKDVGPWAPDNAVDCPKHDSREELPWRFAFADPWLGKAGNYSCIRSGPTVGRAAKHTVWPSSEVSVCLAYDNGLTPAELEQTIAANPGHVVVFVRPDRPGASEFCRVAKERVASHVVLFAAQDAPPETLAVVRDQTAALVKQW